MKTNNFFLEGKIGFLLDASAGSSGKGCTAAFLVRNSNNCNFLITSNSSNASHTVKSKADNIDFVFKCLPSASVYHEKLDAIFICAGATFEIDTLFKEIEYTKIPRNKVKIHPRAAVITDIDIDFEKGLCDLDGNYFKNTGDGTIKTGSTCSGSGAVLAKKTVRNKTLKVASDYPELEEFICRTEVEIMKMLDMGKSGLFEIGQGFQLSRDYIFAPNTTARNVTVSSALNDAMLPPTVVGNVCINNRTFPIRINSKKYVSKEGSVDTFMSESEIPKKYKSNRLFKITHTSQLFPLGTVVYSKTLDTTGVIFSNLHEDNTYDVMINGKIELLDSLSLVNDYKVNSCVIHNQDGKIGKVVKIPDVPNSVVVHFFEDKEPVSVLKSEIVYSEDDKDFPRYYVTSVGGLHLTWYEINSGLVDYDEIDSFSGHGYPDQKELTWQQVTNLSGSPKPLFEATTLTKLPRRVFTFSKTNLEDAIKYNQTPHKIFLALNFCNYVDYEMYGNRDFLTKKMVDWLNDNINPVVSKFPNVGLRYLSTTEFIDDTLITISNSEMY